MSEKFKRQIDLIDWKQLDFNIHIIGVGGIGSWVTLLATKMGCINIHVYDNDTVELHNTASQFFEVEQLKKLKVEAIKQNVKKQSGINVIAHSQEDESNIKEGLIIIAVDSMEERHNLNKLFKNTNTYIIDSRMGGLQMEIYRTPAISWHKTLVKPEVIESEPCTAKSICFNCAFIGSIITHYIRLFAKKELKDGQTIFYFSDPLFLSQKNYEK